MNDRNGVPVKVGARVQITVSDFPSFEGWVRTIRHEDMFARVDNGEQDDEFGDPELAASVRSDEIEVLP